MKNKRILVQRLDHVAIDVMELEKAAAFYGELLGLQEVPRPESFDFPGLWYDLGNSLLHIVAGRKATTGKHHLALWVDDVLSSAQIIEDAGFEVKWDPYKIVDIDRFFTSDPEGNRIEIQGAELEV